MTLRRTTQKRLPMNPTRFSVSLDGRPLPVHAARTSAVPYNREWPGRQRPLDQTETSAFVSFDLDRPAVLSIVVDGLPTDRRQGVDVVPPRVEIRPREFAIPFTVRGNRIEIALDRPRLFTVEVNGYREALHVFANPPAAYAPVPNELRFGPGEHDAGRIFPKDGQTIVLEEGAVVYGAVFAFGAKDVRIVGRGILDASRMLRWDELKDRPDHPEREALRAAGIPESGLRGLSAINVTGCRDVLVEGIVVRDAPFWTANVEKTDGIVFRNVKIVGQWRYNSDGIDLSWDTLHSLVEDCFIRSFDDCVVFRDGAADGIVRNNVLWCDWGKCLEVWTNGSAPIRRIRFEDNHLIRRCSHIISLDAWLSHPSALLEDISYDRTTIDLTGPQLVANYQFADDEPYPADPVREDPPFGAFLSVSHPFDGGGTDVTYRNIHFRDIRVLGGAKPRILLETSRIQHPADITFEACDFGDIVVR